MAVPGISAGQSPGVNELAAYDAFVELHHYQLAAVPEPLWPRLFNKLCNDQLDAGEFFCLEELNAEEAGELGAPYALQVVAGQHVTRESDVFLIDHAWTTAPNRAREQLEASPALLERMAHLMGVELEEEPEDEDGEDEEDNDTTSVADSFDEREADQHSHVDHAMVALAAQQANVTPEAAQAALEVEKWDLISAISRLTLSEVDRNAHEQLEKDVLGRMEQQHQQQQNSQREQQAAARRAQQIDAVLTAMWRFAGTYQVTMLDAEGEHRQEHLWYIMDEVGSAIRHADAPNARAVPFLFVRGPTPADTIPYSLLVPLQDLPAGARVTRDFIPVDITDTLTRQAYLCAFQPPSAATAQQLIRTHQERTSQHALSDHELNVPRAPVILPNASTGTVKVYTDTTFVREHLSLERFELTEDLAEADVIWLTADFAEQFDSLRAGQCVNQLPGEACVVHKHRLAQLIWETYGNVNWYPTSYDLTHELTPAVGHFLENALGSDAQARNENLWILKPWNAGRSIGITVTDSLSRMIRTRDAVPCVAQQYLCRPLLYDGRKFDLRYIVLVRAARPHLRIAVYRMFWTRLANKPFSLDDFHDYEKHFTVMNYTEHAMTQLRHTDFIAKLEREQAGLNWWGRVQPAIDDAIQHVFVAASKQPAPLGFADQSGDAFAVYGVDVMLTDQLQPVLLEVNFAPDCLRACQYEPDFVNHLMGAITGQSGVDKAREAFRDLYPNKK